MRIGRWSIALGIAVLLSGSGLWVSVWAGMLGRQPAPRPSQERREADLPKRFPKAVVDERFHDFGILDPSKPCQYKFTIRNEGEASLTLSRGGTSCKCTMSELPQGEVPPGAQVPVTVSSKVDNVKGDFRHSATILTNDPKAREIVLRIAGKIRNVLAVHPSELLIRSKRDQTSTAEVVVYSEVWDAFTLDKIEPSEKGMTWEVASVDAALLKELGACSGQRIKVQLPPKGKGGSYQEHLQVTAIPQAPGESPRPLTINLNQHVLSPMELQGEKFNGLTSELQLGPLGLGEGAHSRLVLIVNDEHRTLKVQTIEVVPKSLKVELKPMAIEEGRSAVYAIDVDVPADAQGCNYMIDKGKVRIVTDHPRVPVIEFPVSFAVISRR